MLEECVDSWVTQWKQQGLEEGRQEGLIAGEASLFKHLLVKRFGALPNWVHYHLQHASCEELEKWADHLLEARSLEAVFDRLNLNNLPHSS